MASGRLKRTYTLHWDGCPPLPAQFYDIETTFRPNPMPATVQNKPQVRPCFRIYISFSMSRPIRLPWMPCSRTDIRACFSRGSLSTCFSLYLYNLTLMNNVTLSLASL